MRSRSRRRAVTLLAVLAVGSAALLAPAGAAANAFSQLQAAYTRSTDGTIAPCTFGAATLQAGLRQAPSYDFQYGADLIAAIRGALAQRGAGACARGHHPASALSRTARVAGATPGLPGSATAGTGAGLPAVLTALLVLIGAVLLVGLLAGGWWALGYDPVGVQAARHAVAEAEYRLGARWERMSDRFSRPRH